MADLIADPDPRDTHHITLRVRDFTRLLRDNGFIIGTGELLDSLNLADDPAILDPERMRQSWRALLCTQRIDWDRFDELFNAFWLRYGMKQSVTVSGQTSQRKGPKTFAQMSGGGADWLSDWMGDDDGDVLSGGGEVQIQGASHGQSLADVDLAQLSDADQIAQAGELAERLAQRMRRRLNRRHKLDSRGRRLDLRKTIHQSIPFGGTPMRLTFRHRPPKPLKLVLILDASGSMSAYGGFFLRFMRGVFSAFREAEAYAFHTRLVHMSGALRERDAVKAFEKLSLMTAGWSGGTRIGESLETFNHHHAAQVLSGRTVVMILSDGYDTSPPEVLDRELAYIKRRVRRVVWLNPLLGVPGYEPIAAGMMAAMPHIDVFQPAHNLKSLAALEPHLARL